MKTLLSFLLLSSYVSWVYAGPIPKNALIIEGGAWMAKSADIQFQATLLKPLDQMVFVGLGSGYQQHGDEAWVPVFGSLDMRLPIGRALLPLVRGQAGYRLGQDAFFWRAGGGADLKLGRHTCLWATAGIEGEELRGKVFYGWASGGLLWEW
jgi:hypothetical protein